jgi:uncharacterized protein (DUF488 family)
MNDSAVDAALTIWTIGHSTRSIEEFTRLLAPVAIDLLVDIRSIPRSRTNPQFNREALPTALAATGVDYRHLPELGGLRGPRKDGVASPNNLWRSGAFRNYADYAAANPAFRLGLGELQAPARDRRHIAIMCAEAVWWRCHRRIVSDYLLVAGFAVGHILSGDRIEPARLTPGAILQPDGTIIYPAPTAPHPNLLI